MFNPARFGYIEASTKSGKTVSALAWLLEQAHYPGKAGRNYWWVAPVYPQAAIAYTRAKAGLNPGTFKANETDLTLTLSFNGAVIWFKSGEKPDNLYGEDVYACVVDEASRVREEAWWAIRTVLTATGGPCRMIGNVKGRKNWFYRDARKAESNEPNTHYAKITAYDAVQAGVITKSEVDQARAQLPENVFRELYEAEPSDDGGNPFGLRSIQTCIADTLAQPVAYAPYVQGVDLGKSVDWTVGIVLNQNGDLVDMVRFQHDWATTRRLVSAQTRSYNRAPSLVDATGLGDPIVEELQREEGLSYEGFKYTPQSKQQLMEGLQIAIQGRRISFPNDRTLIAELESFEYEYTRTGVRFNAPEGSHDDTVNALALAVRHMAKMPAVMSRKPVLLPRPG